MAALGQIFDAVIIWAAVAVIIAMGLILLVSAWFALADFGELLFGGKARRSSRPPATPDA